MSELDSRDKAVMTAAFIGLDEYLTYKPLLAEDATEEDKRIFYEGIVKVKDAINRMERTLSWTEDAIFVIAMMELLRDRFQVRLGTLEP
jgi:hypothetical protein